jgi:hypothetical protein
VPDHKELMIRTIGTSVSALLLALALPSALAAQQGGSTSAQQLVEELRREGLGNGAAAAQTITRVLLFPEEFPAGLPSAVADELKELVLRGTENSQLTIMAITLVAYARSPDRMGPLAGTVERLEAMYVGSDRSMVRSQVLYSSMNVSDRGETANFLSRAARADDDLAFTAVSMLELLGPTGLDALRALYEGSEPDRAAVRDYLQMRAAENFASRVAGGEGS